MHKLPPKVVQLIRAVQEVFDSPDFISQVLGIDLDSVLPCLEEKKSSPIPPDLQDVIAHLAAMEFTLDQISSALGLDRLWVGRHVDQSGTLPLSALSERARRILDLALAELSR